jgi:hypothetical protein
VSKYIVVQVGFDRVTNNAVYQVAQHMEHSRGIYKTAIGCANAPADLTTALNLRAELENTK